MKYRIYTYICGIYIYFSDYLSSKEIIFFHLKNIKITTNFFRTMAEGEEESQKVMMRLTVKTARKKVVVEVDKDTGVKELRDIVSEKFNASAEEVCLIFAGKILNDGEKLKEHKLEDGRTVLMCIRRRQGTGSQPNNRTASAATSNSAAPPPAISPDILGEFGGQ